MKQLCRGLKMHLWNKKRLWPNRTAFSSTRKMKSSSWWQVCKVTFSIWYSEMFTYIENIEELVICDSTFFPQMSLVLLWHNAHKICILALCISVVSKKIREKMFGWTGMHIFWACFNTVSDTWQSWQRSPTDTNNWSARVETQDVSFENLHACTLDCRQRRSSVWKISLQ